MDEDVSISRADHADDCLVLRARDLLARLEVER